ncbi:hypothetical protein [Roseinatronobacter bogoriensis]|uniref:Replication initiation factor n=1 Tax=Roseinatronobacter bogoriensis subsp. barguzinensis TaxID=441209 RepID=A0A2K8KCR5_9RHOB|nr:hypothetical protein [Rhodobaca]ATX64558.1 hypothetical protein BG454_00855 [Rhodobaca barguzinensis]MBB4209739.1 hypothetical protein [Rhodobaca bogoriensis DSM 18756]TDW33710.1 hypothetical protein LY39_03543 [Rhodobaca barguzinensis]TDY66181.1 hypothetical protein EV660_11334 [Rhodobaca bogoriensis DSM 18756]
MILIRKGFDGLDISYPLTINEDLASKLALAQEVSANSAQNGLTGNFQHNGLMMTVAPTGAKGGYAFRCDSGAGGPFGAIWFFKKPTGRKDEWGVRVSCRALPLAMDGLAKTRAHIEDTLARLGLDYQPGTESISRVDVACDVLAPDLAPDRGHFVASARSGVQEISDNILQINGRSGRVETITVGKSPGRQVVLYDKRAEVIKTRKEYWVPIWNDALAVQGLPPLDMKRRAHSAVWRIEIRAGKSHLKDKHGVSTWGDLRERLPKILKEALRQVRFTVPASDSNRARWPNHPLWVLVRNALADDMADLGSMVDQSIISEMVREERDEMLMRQIAGCLISRAGLNGVSQDRLGAYAMGCADQIMRAWQRKPDQTRERLAQARAKYGRVKE